MSVINRLRELLTGGQASLSMPAKLAVAMLAMAAIGSLGYYAYAEGTGVVTDVQGKTDAFIQSIAGPLGGGGGGGGTLSASFIFTAGSVNFDASASTGDIVSYIWDFGDGNSQTTSGPTVTHSYSSDGDYTATLTVEDGAGNTDSASTTVSITGGSVGGMPTASFSYSPSNPSPGEAISFDASGSTDDNGIAEYRWDFGDGNGETTTAPTVSHTYSSDGDYTVELTVVDADGGADITSETVSVSGSTVSASFDHSPSSGINTATVVTFDASPSSGSIKSYVWGFGDGSAATGQTASHTYSSQGTYDVLLTLLGTDGSTDATTEPLTVETVAPPDTILASGDSDSSADYITLYYYGTRTDGGVDLSTIESQLVSAGHVPVQKHDSYFGDYLEVTDMGVYITDGHVLYRKRYNKYGEFRSFIDGNEFATPQNKFDEVVASTDITYTMPVDDRIALPFDYSGVLSTGYNAEGRGVRSSNSGWKRIRADLKFVNGGAGVDHSWGAHRGEVKIDDPAGEGYEFRARFHDGAGWITLHEDINYNKYLGYGVSREWNSNLDAHLSPGAENTLQTYMAGYSRGGYPRGYVRARVATFLISNSQVTFSTVGTEGAAEQVKYLGNL